MRYQHSRKLEWLIVSVLTCVFVYFGYSAMLQTAPQVTIFNQTQYPRQVVRGGFFYLSFDVSYNTSCNVTTRRVIVGNDGVEYLAQEENKDVVKDQRMTYIVRVPVSDAIPYGNAVVRSDFEYQCNFWSRYLAPLQRSGQGRQIEVIKDEHQTRLEPVPGYVIVESYYRKLPND